MMGRFDSRSGTLLWPAAIMFWPGCFLLVGTYIIMDGFIDIRFVAAILQAYLFSLGLDGVMYNVQYNAEQHLFIYIGDTTTFMKHLHQNQK